MDETTTIDTSLPTVSTDLLDYQPGDTATITASNFIIGSTLVFQVQHADGPGDDGVWGTWDDVIEDTSGEGHEEWYITDGVRTAGADGILGTADDGGDLDGIADGNITTSWNVTTDDSLGATFLLTAQTVEAGTDETFGTDDDVTIGPKATAAFTDATSLVSSGNLVHRVWDPSGANNDGTLNPYRRSR